MQRVGFSPKETVDTGLSFGEGNGEIVAAKVVVHQFPANKKTGEQSGPFVAFALDIQRCDSDWKLMDEDPITEYLGVGGGIDNAEEGENRFRFHPAVGDNENDPDAEDQGEEIGAEGNMLGVVKPGDQVHKKSKAAIFGASLVKYGFKNEKLNGWMPHLVGTKAHFIKIMLEKDAGRDYKNDPSCLGVDKIMHFGYETKASAKTGAVTKPASKAPTVAAPANGKASAKGAKAAETTTDDELSAVAMQLLTAAGAKIAGQEGITRAKVASRLVMFFPKFQVKAEQQKKVQALVRDDEWFTQACETLGWGVDGDDVVVPAAE